MCDGGAPQLGGGGGSLAAACGQRDGSVVAVAAAAFLQLGCGGGFAAGAARPSFISFSSRFFFLLPISSSYISPLQCWSSASPRSSRLCSFGFYIALAPSAFFEFFLFSPILWFPSQLSRYLCIGIHAALGTHSLFLAWCFFSWTHGWGVFGLSLILE